MDPEIPSAISKAKKDVEIPDMFICPISMQIMTDPQISKCGHMFDRDSILRWLKGDYDPEKREIKRGCPVCNKDMELGSLSPCYPVKKAIDEFMKASEGNTLSGSTNTNISNQSLESNQSGLSFESTKSGAVVEEPRPRSSSSMSKIKESIIRTINGEGSRKRKKVWCILTPVVQGTFEKIHVFREDFQIGRNPGADFVLKLQEVSHFHCKIRRRKQASTGKYEIIIEDKSTNGTFINGQKVGKTNLNSAFHGDCLSIGRKFIIEKDVPQLENWIDWVFAGSSDLQERQNDIKKLKSIDRFDTLLQFSDSDYGKLGIASESVVNTVMLALKAWRYDHRFPSYFIEVLKPELYLNNPSGSLTPLQKYVNMTQSGRSSNSEHTVSTVILSPVTNSPSRDRYSTAPALINLDRLDLNIIDDDRSEYPDTESTKSRKSKNTSTSSIRRLESIESSPMEGEERGYNSVSSSRKPSTKDIVGEIFSKDKIQFKSPKVILCGEALLHEKMASLYPMLHSDVVDIVIDYEKQVFGKESLDLEEMPILEKRCRRKLDELTARKAKIIYTQDSHSSSTTTSQKLYRM